MLVLYVHIVLLPFNVLTVGCDVLSERNCCNVVVRGGGGKVLLSSGSVAILSFACASELLGLFPFPLGGWSWEREGWSWVFPFSHLEG